MPSSVTAQSDTYAHSFFLIAYRHAAQSRAKVRRCGPSWLNSQRLLGGGPVVGDGCLCVRQRYVTGADGAV